MFSQDQRRRCCWWQTCWRLSFCNLIVNEGGWRIVEGGDFFGICTFGHGSRCGYQSRGLLNIDFWFEPSGSVCFRIQLGMFDPIYFLHPQQKVWATLSKHIPSRMLSYPTLAKVKVSSTMSWEGTMLVSSHSDNPLSNLHYSWPHFIQHCM